MTQPAVLHAWYSVPVASWVLPILGVSLLLVLASFAIDWKRGRL